MFGTGVPSGPAQSNSQFFVICRSCGTHAADVVVLHNFVATGAPRSRWSSRGNAQTSSASQAVVGETRAPICARKPRSPRVPEEAGAGCCQRLSTQCGSERTTRAGSARFQASSASARCAGGLGVETAAAAGRARAHDRGSSVVFRRLRERAVGVRCRRELPIAISVCPHARTARVNRPSAPTAEPYCRAAAARLDYGELVSLDVVRPLAICLIARKGGSHERRGASSPACSSGAGCARFYRRPPTAQFTRAALPEKESPSAEIPNLRRRGGAARPRAAMSRAWN